MGVKYIAKFIWQARKERKRLNTLLSSSSKPGKRPALGHTFVDFQLSSLGSLMACMIQEGLAPSVSPSRDVQNMLQGYFLGESCSQRRGLQPCLQAVRVDSRGLFREQELKVPPNWTASGTGMWTNIGLQLVKLPIPSSFLCTQPCGRLRGLFSGLVVPL